MASSISRNQKNGVADTTIDFLSAFSNVTILYERRSTPSTYIPSAKMMFYIVHHMNNQLCDSNKFSHVCPNFHPYILRLYCGILFWIQCLRAQTYARKSDVEQHTFLDSFLDMFPPESLPVPGPLLLLFKTLCTSQPEFKNYGLVTPVIPVNCGPSKRSYFINNDYSSHFLPNVPGIFALLTHLNSCLDQNIYPSKGSHCPVTDEATTFGFHYFPDFNERSRFQSWSLVSPGLDHRCEADRKMHCNFARHYADFKFPEFTADDSLSSIDEYLSMKTEMQWFGNVCDVAAAVSEFFKNSGSLDECPPYGLNANQYVVNYYNATPAHLPTPRKIADPNAMYPLAVRVSTSVRNIHQLTLATSAFAQTNITAPPNHPACSQFGAVGNSRFGDIWNFWPIETSNVNEHGYLALQTIIRDHFNAEV